MKVRVEATSTAIAQLDELDEWWRANRTAASGQVRDEYTGS